MSCLSLILALSLSALAPREAMASPEEVSPQKASQARRSASAENALTARQDGAARAENTGRPSHVTPGRDAAATGHSALQARRAELRDAQRSLEVLTSERQDLEARHSDLNRRIEALKAEHLARDPLWSSPALESLLRDSQELSGILAQKGVEERRLGQLVLKQQERLASALDREIGSLHAAWSSSTPIELRKKIVPRLRALHAERRELLLSSVLTSSQELLPKLSTQDADDPSVLLEMADAFLDSEDKLRREERALARHIERLENEQELERRLSSLMEEESLFDESERRISLSRAAHLYSESRVPTAGAAETVAASSDDSAALPLPASEAEAAGNAQSQAGVESGQTSDCLGMAVAGAPVEKNPIDASSQGSERALGNHLAADELGATTSDSATSKTADSALTLLNSDVSGPAGRSNLEILSSGGKARPFQGDWSESNSIQALRAHQAYLKAKADELHHKAEEATRKARDLL